MAKSLYPWIEPAEASAEDDALDARRYRWLRQFLVTHGEHRTRFQRWPSCAHFRGVGLDAIVDAEMANDAGQHKDE